MDPRGKRTSSCPITWLALNSWNIRRIWSWCGSSSKMALAAGIISPGKSPWFYNLLSSTSNCPYEQANKSGRGTTTTWEAISIRRPSAGRRFGTFLIATNRSERSGPSLSKRCRKIVRGQKIRSKTFSTPSLGRLSLEQRQSSRSIKWAFSP